MSTNRDVTSAWLVAKDFASEAVTLVRGEFYYSINNVIRTRNDKDHSTAPKAATKLPHQK